MSINWLEKGLEFKRIVQNVESVKKDQQEKMVLPREQKLITPKTYQFYQRLKRIPNDRRKPLVARQIMSSPVVTLNPENTIEEAKALIVENRFHHLPVVSDTNVLVGILSDGDIFCKASTGECLPVEILDMGESPKIADIMIKRVLVGKEDTQIPYIAKILIEEHVSALPIIDKKKTPVGIVTRSDVLKTLLYKAPLDQWV
jgi:acetoin utilization protein AcuB